MERIAATMVRAIVYSLSLLPLSLARAIGRGAGYLVWKFDFAIAQVTRENIALCFADLSASEQEAMALESLQHTMALAMESGVLWHWSESRWQKLICESEGLALLESLQAEGKAVLVLVPHFGNWEFFALFLGRFRFTCLYDPPRISPLEAPMVEARQRTGGTLLPIGRAGVRGLTRALNEGGISILLPDQVPDPKSGVMAPFFGHPALTMTLAQKLARRADAQILMASVARVTEGFSVTIEPVDPRAKSEDEVEAATALNAAVERVVERDPAQYQWEYKRFKVPRAGKTTSY